MKTEYLHTSYLSFLLHWQDFRKPNFTPKKTTKGTKNTKNVSEKVKYMHFFHSIWKNFTWQKIFTQTCLWCLWQIRGMYGRASPRKHLRVAELQPKISIWYLNIYEFLATFGRVELGRRVHFHIVQLLIEKTTKTFLCRGFLDFCFCGICPYCSHPSLSWVQLSSDENPMGVQNLMDQKYFIVFLWLLLCFILLLLLIVSPGPKELLGPCLEWARHSSY